MEGGREVGRTRDTLLDTKRLRSGSGTALMGDPNGANALEDKRAARVQLGDVVKG